MTQHRIHRLRGLLEFILTKHLTAAIDELATSLDDELEERVRDRVEELRKLEESAQ